MALGKVGDVAAGVAVEALMVASAVGVKRELRRAGAEAVMPRVEIRNQRQTNHSARLE